jgi:hypothetical protein
MLAALGGKFGKSLEAYRLPDNDKMAWSNLRERLNQRDLFFVAPRNVGPTATNPATKPQTQLRRRYMLLGESLEGMQAWDVFRALQTIRTVVNRSDNKLHVRARGDLAAAALYAAQRERPWSPANLELVAPPASHRAGAPLFHILRHLDMPQAVALVAENAEVKLLDVNESEWSFAVKTAANLNWKDRLTIVNQAPAGE